MIFLTFNLFERINFYLLCAFYILLFRNKYLSGRTVSAICQT